jgi:quercetin dioxygenase-like cupin family protein
MTNPSSSNVATAPGTSAALAPLLATAADGITLSITGDRYRILATGAHTGGAFMAMICDVAPDHGPPPHVHHREDETFFVIHGCLTLYLNGQRRLLHAGELAFAPRDIPHRFHNETDQDVRFLLIASPAGLEHFFQEIGTPLPSPDASPVPMTQADLDKIIEACPRYGMELLLPGA